MVLQLICFVTSRFYDMRSPTDNNDKRRTSSSCRVVVVVVAAAAAAAVDDECQPQKRAKSNMKVFATISSGRPASWR
jgi:hypothetical protein